MIIEILRLLLITVLVLAAIAGLIHLIKPLFLATVYSIIWKTYFVGACIAIGVVIALVINGRL